MKQNQTFQRWDRSSAKNDSDFRYQSDKIEMTPTQMTSMHLRSLGFNLHLQVQNYTSEPIIMTGSTRSVPTVIDPIMIDGTQSSSSDRVVITIHHWSNELNAKSKTQFKDTVKTQIIITGRKLRSGAVFIDELDQYLCTLQDHMVAERFIREDARHTDWERLAVEIDMAQRDPSKIYDGFQDLSHECIARQDLIQVRVGDPHRAQDMRIALLDTYFTPALNNRLVYDPGLDADTFVIEFLRQAPQREFYGSLSELLQAGTIFVDQNEVTTISGKFSSLVVFADVDHLARYFHKRKSVERFAQESVFIAEYSGDMKLKEDIERLNQQIETLKNTAQSKDLLLEDRDAHLKRIAEQLKTMTDQKKYLEEELRKIKDHWATNQSSEVVTQQLINERFEAMMKAQTAHTNYKTQEHKSRVEVFKSIVSVISIAFTILTTMKVAYDRFQKT